MTFLHNWSTCILTVRTTHDMFNGVPFQPKLPLDLRSLVISLANTYVHQKVKLHEATKSKHIHDNWKDTLSPLHYEDLKIFSDFEQ